MRKLLSILAFFTMVLSLSAQIQMPIEVLGEEGLIVRRELNLSQDEAASVNRLWLQVNNLSYENKASVRVNTGQWIDLNHNTVDMAAPEKARGGMVHGGFNTVRLSIPVTDWVAGTNIIRFRFNNSDGISMGYRVVKMNLLNSSGGELLTEDDFVEDNPADWQPIHDDPASIAAGEDLWRNAQLWANYLETDSKGQWYGYTLNENKNVQIRAKCTDCHAQDGRDLEMFAYSNYSIIERSKFHGLSEYDGELIASYIRSLSEKDDKIKRVGRPWNPPYQPGKELEGKPIEEWHAGAGLDAVLEEDKDMLPYLFPNGVNPEEIEKLFDQNTPDIDRTTLPLAIQFPDWKHWLPMVHPKDAFTKGTFYEDTYNDRSEYKNSQTSKLNPEKAYEMFREYLETLPKKGDGKTIDLASMSQAQKDELIEKHENYHANSRFFMQQGQNGGQHWRTKTGIAQDALANGVPLTFANTSIARLMAVKNFEIMNEYGLLDQMQEMWESEDYPTKRQYMHGKSHNVFEVPPHFTGNQDDGGTEHFLGQSDATGHYETTSWYELQNVLGGGEGNGWWNGPVDYNYQPQFIVKASGSSGVDEPLRYYHSVKTMYKVKSWSGNTDVGDGYGFRIRQQGPWRFFGKQGRFTRNGFYDHEPGTWAYLLDEVQPGMSKMILDALFKEFLKAVEQYPLASWPRDGGNGVREGQYLGPLSQSSFIDVTQRVTPPTDVRPIWSDNMMWLIPVAQEHGVDCQVLDEFIDWCQAAWPNLDFNQFKGGSNVKVELFHNRSCDGGVEARVANVGNNPNYIWEVNGVAVNQNVTLLTDDYFELGDEVYLRVNGTSNCATRLGVTDATITINEVSDCTQEMTPIDSAYYDFSDADYSNGIIDQWNGNDLSSLPASRVDDGVNQFVNFTGTESATSNIGGLEFTSAKATIESWIKVKNNVGTAQRIVSINPSGVILFRVNPNGSLQVVISKDVEGTIERQTENSPNQLPNEVWTHVAATISETELILYVNGQEDSRFDLNFPFDLDGNGDGLQVMLGSPTVAPVGALDEVKIYNRVLSALEIQTSFESYNIKPEAFLSVNPSTNITEGDIVDVTWGGTDVHGTIVSTEIYRNGNIRNWTTPFEWTAIAGTHTIEVVVIDNDGAKDTASVDIVVSSPTVNIQPVSNIIASPNSNLRVGDVVTLTFGGTDADGSIESITLKQNNQLRTWSSPYNWAATAGIHEFEVTVTDNEGAQHTSSITLNVSANTVPIVNLSVIPNSNVTEGDELEVTFSGSDSDGTIVSTTIQLNGVTQNWTNPQTITATVGTMLFEVIVEDNDGAISRESITIQVDEEISNIEPLAFLEITPDSTLNLGDEVEITFGGEDEDGTIESVLIYLNGVEQNWTSPYIWAAEAGDYTIEVVVTDNEGATNTISQSLNVESIQTSVNVLNNEYQVSVYPNPTNEYFIIDVDLSVSSVLEYCFYSASGDLITKRVFRTNQGMSKQYFEVDALGLPDGVVLIQIQDGESMITKKIIVKD